MRLTSKSFDPDLPIPHQFALGLRPPQGHFDFAENESPHLAWADVPAGTRSFALLCVDPDVPSVGDDVNQEGRTVARDLPRVEFVHWAMVDVPPGLRELEEGSCGRGVVPGGKDAPPGPEGARQGRNDYTDWFAGDPEMGGTWRGYDGPAPPWNDERLHHYHFQLFALDVERLAVDGVFTAADVRAAMHGHVLAEAELIGTYTLNPDVG